MAHPAQKDPRKPYREHYRDHVPCDALRPYVQDIWTTIGDGRGTSRRVHTGLPDMGTMDILLISGGPCRFTMTGKDHWLKRGSHATGLVTQMAEYETTKGSHLVGVRFKPGGAHLFMGAPSDELTDGAAPLSALWNGAARELEERVFGAKDAAGRMLRLEEALLERLLRSGQELSPAAPALEMIERTRGTASVQELADRMGWSLRNLNHVFRRWVGLSAKKVSRIARFRSALSSMLESGCADWRECVAELGYTDQAHLIHEFKSFTGMSPARYISGL